MIPAIIPLIAEGIQLASELIQAGVRVQQEWNDTGTVSPQTAQAYLDRLKAATDHRNQLEAQTIVDLTAIN